MVESSSNNDQDSLNSKLAKKEFWDQHGEMELKNFKETGDIGEVWYGTDVQKRVVKFIFEQYVEGTDPTMPLNVLDMGTGNGAFLFKLSKKGIYR